MNKLLTKKKLIQWRTYLKEHGNSLVVATGCFDILHVGHIDCLRKAQSFGELLLVGIDNDQSVKKLKGETRPINSEENRAEVLSSLYMVNTVYIYENTLDFLRMIKPDVWVKGGDYTINSLNQDEVKAVQENGGIVQIVKIKYPCSSSKIIEKIAYV
jgi:rfaE bifunctional protein nucleotidyltransferase chain/domain